MNIISLYIDNSASWKHFCSASILSSSGVRKLPAPFISDLRIDGLTYTDTDVVFMKSRADWHGGVDTFGIVHLNKATMNPAALQTILNLPWVARVQSKDNCWRQTRQLAQCKAPWL